MSESDTRALAKIQTEIGQVSQSLTSGAQVAVFPYRLNRIYQIDIKPGNFTTFMIPKNEPIRQFAVSNTEAAEIVVNEQANAAMLKLTAKISLSATIVTDKRAYFLTILPAQDSWHQGVSWTYDDGQGGSIASANASAGAMAAAAAATAGTFGFRSSGTSNAFQEPVANTEEGLVGQPNFNYRFSGDTDITPIAVWDNGRFTWIQFPNQVQSLPAVFVMGPDGPEVVNYVVQPGGKQIKVNRLMPRFLLRLGSRKVTVEAQ
jgi:type IV secretion system protein VirB9